VKLLVFSSLYPNPVEPHHGVFVRNRLLRYLERHDAQALVVAPVPLAPPVGPERWTRLRAIPAQEQRDGLTVLHPRWPSPPGFGDRFRGALMATGVRRSVLAAARRFQPDVFDVHYAFPDGAAAARLRPRLDRALGRRLPATLTCRGTDLNLLPGFPAVRPEVVGALAAADHVITVAEALRGVALELGQAPERVTTLRNGVDLERFSPGPMSEAREATGLPPDARIVLCVGHLIERKGQHLLLPAFAASLARQDPTALLVFVGRGESEQSLRAAAEVLGVADRVRFVEPVEPAVLARWYRAADVLVLASLREGWPNVVLEALACGTPVLATRVWGTPEILTGCAAGRLADPTVDGLAAGLADLDDLDRSAARPWAEAHGWDETVDGMADVFQRVCAG
jgi:glycosyltransferase involved in cell wall biosynthesis